MLKINKLDHIWRLFLILVFLVGVWVFTRAVWLETLARDTVVAIITLAVNNKLEALKNNNQEVSINSTEVSTN